MNKKVNVELGELSPDEVKMIADTRRQKALEADFQQARLTVGNFIAEKLNEATKALSEAIKASEKNGIPFTWDGPGMPQARNYIPSTLYNKWRELGKDRLMEEFNLNSDSAYGEWEYWSASSLTC